MTAGVQAQPAHPPNPPQAPRAEDRLPPMETPWGRSDFTEHLGCGIIAVSTPSHGGMYVPKHLHCLIPDRARAWAAKWSGSESWYEEDCAWAIVVHWIPEPFAKELRESAAAMLKSMIERGRFDA